MLLIVALFAILSSLLLPALGTTASASLSGDQVSVLQRKTVGVYETATLSSRDGQAVFDWLNQNGFVAPTNFIPAIRAYAQEGWYFVASKIRLDASLPEGAKPHPLMLTFKTDHPVYPLRLTGIQITTPVESNSTFSGRAGRKFLISKSSAVRNLPIHAGKGSLR